MLLHTIENTFSWMRSRPVSPPTLLMVLTVLMLFVGIATANATPLLTSIDHLTEECQARLAEPEDGPKWGFLAAACDLYEADYEDFLGYTSEDLALLVEEFSSFDGAEPWPDDRFFIDATVSEEEWNLDVAPLLRELALDRESLSTQFDFGYPTRLECNDQGECQQFTGESEIWMQFVQDGEEIKLQRITVEYYEWGC